jgi:predicted nucleic acid-binding protein
MITDAEPFALAGLIVTEVLQGLTRNITTVEEFLSMWEILEPQGLSTYRKAASIFRLARSRGITPTTIDALIAAIALENRASVFTLDKDFSQIARITALRLYPLTHLQKTTTPFKSERTASASGRGG